MPSDSPVEEEREWWLRRQGFDEAAAKALSREKPPRVWVSDNTTDCPAETPDAQ